MNFRIHTFQEELNKGILLNLNEACLLKTQGMLMSLFFSKVDNCAESTCTLLCLVSFTPGENFLAGVWTSSNKPLKLNETLFA